MPEASPDVSTKRNGYAIISHGGIGDELWEDAQREKPRHNLSGSCHELQIHVEGQALRILVDIWAYQWRGKLEREIKKVSDGVSAVVLTHPHMDHIGDFPRIFTEGWAFEGRVFSTPGTLQATQIALIDAAKILQREYEKKVVWWKKTTEEVAAAFFTLKSADAIGKKRVARTPQGNRVSQTGTIVDKKVSIQEAHATLQKHGIALDMKDTWREEMKRREPEKPAYTIEDVYASLWAIETHEIKDGWKDLVPWQVAFRFYNAGHIIGSVSVLFRITQEKKSKYVLFSGDLWSYKWDMHPTGVATPPHNLPIDTVMIESTYGAKVREDFAIGLSDFEANLKRDLGKYRRVTISTFAMDRTQNILARLIKMKLAGEIDADIVLDSPAGIQHTQAYVQATQNLDELIVRPKAASIQALLWDDFEARESVLLGEYAEYIDPKNGHYIIADKDSRESLFAANESGRKMIVLTASGMADWGMVIHHLQSNIEDPTTVFYFPGYLVPGTLGYAIANKDQPGGQQKRVTIEGETYEVKARMKQFNFLSGHGDAEDLRAWLRALKLPKGANIRVVHGDVNGSSLEFAHSLERDGWFAHTNVIVPNIWEENFFPFDIPATKKSTRRRKSWLWPLVVEPGPARRKIEAPKVEKSRKTSKKWEILRKDSWAIVPPKKQLRTAIKVWRKVGAERNRYADIIRSAHSTYDSFYREFMSMPIPFFQATLKYYSDVQALEKLQEEKGSLDYSLNVNQKKLFKSENPPKDKKISDVTDPSIIRQDIAALEARIEENKRKISILEGTMRWNLIQAKVSAQSVSKWVIESLWYTTKQIETHPEIIPLEDENDVKRIVVETLIKVLQYDPDTTGNVYGLLTQLVTVMRVQPHVSWDYEAQDKTTLQALGKINVWYSLSSSAALLMGKINPDYVFQPQSKKVSNAAVKIPRKAPVKEEWPKVNVAVAKKTWNTKEVLLAEIAQLELERKKYSQYHLQKKDSLSKDRNRLQELRGIHARGDMPSRGKFKDLSSVEIEDEFKRNTWALKSVNASLRNPRLVDDQEQYDDLIKTIRGLATKLARMK